MVTRVSPDIDFSTFPDSDGEPVAENLSNFIQISDLIFSTRARLAPRRRFHVGGNQFIYYNPLNGRDHVSPDVFVLLDVEPWIREKVLVWEEGKFPDVVFEITSPSTYREDLESKRVLYDRLGAQEYYIYDPQQELQPALRGYQRMGDHLEPMTPLPSGGIYSAALDAELRVVGQWLRVIDPESGEPVTVPEELLTEYLAAEERVREEVLARRAAETRVQQADMARRQAEMPAGQSDMARQEADMARQKAELALRGAHVQIQEMELALREAHVQVGQADLARREAEMQARAAEERAAQAEAQAQRELLARREAEERERRSMEALDARLMRLEGGATAGE